MLWRMEKEDGINFTGERLACILPDGNEGLPHIMNAVSVSASRPLRIPRSAISPHFSDAKIPAAAARGFSAA